MPPGVDPSPVPRIWVICGAGRGVGKTRLAQALCAALPRAVYAKQGTSRRKAGKPESLFREDSEVDAFIEAEGSRGRAHLVIESNALARQGRGDIIIFLEAGPGSERPPRADADLLRSRAGIVIDGAPACGRRATARAWRESLERIDLDPAVGDEVMIVLQAQQEWTRQARA